MFITGSPVGRGRVYTGEPGFTGRARVPEAVLWHPRALFTTLPLQLGAALNYRRGYR
jgi:hypothetical protein